MCVYFFFDSSGVKSHEVPSGQFPSGPLGGPGDTVDAMRCGCLPESAALLLQISSLCLVALVLNCCLAKMI